MTFGPDRVRQWSEELARDPGSPAFFPLADAYREQGRHASALRLCLRGLERNPEHVDAHVLLGQLYRDAGDRIRAADEWTIALRLDPAHSVARRELETLLGKDEAPGETGAADPAVAHPVAAAEFQALAEEMRAASRELRLGEWETALLETDRAAVHLAPIADGLLVVATDPALATGASRRAADRLRRAAASLGGAGEGA